MPLKESKLKRTLAAFFSPNRPLKNSFLTEKYANSSMNLRVNFQIHGFFSILLMPWRQSGLIFSGTGANGQYGWSYYAIEAIGGDSFPGQITPSMRTSEMRPISNKIILVDWPGAPDRTLDQISAWHTVKGKGLFNILCGDNHVEAYLFTAAQRYPITPWGAT